MQYITDTLGITESDAKRMLREFPQYELPQKARGVIIDFSKRVLVTNKKQNSKCHGN